MSLAKCNRLFLVTVTLSMMTGYRVMGAYTRQLEELCKVPPSDLLPFASVHKVLRPYRNFMKIYHEFSSNLPANGETTNGPVRFMLKSSGNIGGVRGFMEREKVEGMYCLHCVKL